MTRFHLPMLALTATQLVSVGFVIDLARVANQPMPIAGGKFEASGVTHVPGTAAVLFVDDSRTREVFWMELAADGSQKSAATPIALDADITDPEGITTDGRWFYLVGSQSKKSGFDGDGLVRFQLDAQSRRVQQIERVQGIKRWLAGQVAELKDMAERVGEDGVNIEGLAWDPARRRLLLGLRSPVPHSNALVIPITLRDHNAPLTKENLAVEGGAAITIQLDGAGIRSMEFDEDAKAFRIIAGEGSSRQNRDFRIVEWSGDGNAVREIARFERRLKPEGITRAVIDGKPRSVVVFDTSRFTLLD